MRDISISIPLIVGVSATSLTIIVHAFAVGAIVRFVRHERRLGRASSGFLLNVLIITVAVMFALAAHLIEIALWALAFLTVREFSSMSTAFYHSASNYTTLGDGDVVMSPAWRLLGPIEAADGIADVRRLDCADFHCHPAAVADSIPGPSRLSRQRISLNGSCGGRP